VYFYRQNRRNAAHDALYKALETYRASVSAEPVPGRISFRTEADKNAKAIHDYESVAKKFSRTTEGEIARNDLALTYHSMGNMVEQKQLERTGRAMTALALARLTLADISVPGKDQEAQKITSTRSRILPALFKTAPNSYGALSQRSPEEARNCF
jgi:hypothetical protein